ncbi:MAG: hypothetical protein JOZ54_19240, partial [Acidobacteria bacterium]|nr:hypothetical protein [Acidobacteriota bacterium]
MHLLRLSTGSRFVLPAAMLLAAACSDNTTEPSTPSAITITSGAAIPGRVAGTATVTVSVAASNGKTLASQPVTFAVTTGGGSVLPASTSTDANGQATTVWTFGNTLGA